MSHDVFISYSSKDKHTADAICHHLEESGLRCWIAPRNIRAGVNYAGEIMDGIKSAKIVVLVFSKSSQESIYVNNEIETAFSNNKPIITYKIDETLPEDKMGFLLKNKHWLDAYPHPENHFKTLIKDAHRLCDETIVSKEKPHLKSDLKKYKLPITLILIVIVCVVLFSGIISNDTTSQDNGIDIINFGVSKVSAGTNSGNYTYSVGILVSPDLVENSRYVRVNLLDSSGNVIGSNTTEVNLFDSLGNVVESNTTKIGSDNAYYSDLYVDIPVDDNITKVSVELHDKIGTIISQDEKDI